MQKLCRLPANLFATLMHLVNELNHCNPYIMPPCQHFSQNTIFRKKANHIGQIYIKPLYSTKHFEYIMIHSPFADLSQPFLCSQLLLNHKSWWCCILSFVQIAHSATVTGYWRFFIWCLVTLKVSPSSTSLTRLWGLYTTRKKQPVAKLNNSRKVHGTHLHPW